MPPQLLRLDASARRTGSVTRELNDRIVERFRNAGPVKVTTRDLADPLPLLSEGWINANFTDPAERTPEQRETLSLSDELVAELRAADVLVMGLPIYNFGVPSSLKAWIDLVSRARETFIYSEAGPRGLLEGKRAIVSVAPGGTAMGSEVDFATGYLKHVLGFIGIDDVVFVAADQLMIDAEASRAAAKAAVEALPLAA